MVVGLWEEVALVVFPSLQGTTKRLRVVCYNVCGRVRVLAMKGRVRVRLRRVLHLDILHGKMI